MKQKVLVRSLSHSSGLDNYKKALQQKVSKKQPQNLLIDEKKQYKNIKLPVEIEFKIIESLISQSLTEKEYFFISSFLDDLLCYRLYKTHHTKIYELRALITTYPNILNEYCKANINTAIDCYCFNWQLIKTLFSDHRINPTTALHHLILNEDINRFTKILALVDPKWIINNKKLIEIALTTKNNKFLNELLAKGAKPSIQQIGILTKKPNNTGNEYDLLLKYNIITPDQLAMLNDFSLFKCLVTKNLVNINKKNLYGSTLLHIAVEKGDYKLAENLLKKGASLNILDSQDKTAYLYALKKINKKHHDWKIFFLLLQYGAQLNEIDKLAILNNINSYSNSLIPTEDFSIIKNYMKTTAEAILTLHQYYPYNENESSIIDLTPIEKEFMQLIDPHFVSLAEEAIVSYENKLIKITTLSKINNVNEYIHELLSMIINTPWMLFKHSSAYDTHFDIEPLENIFKKHIPIVNQKIEQKKLEIKKEKTRLKSFKIILGLISFHFAYSLFSKLFLNKTIKAFLFSYSSYSKNLLNTYFFKY
ncbi:MAG: ankyrin repeat domain-containing protein [Candidatus Babeliales bacterium]